MHKSATATEVAPEYRRKKTKLPPSDKFVSARGPTTNALEMFRETEIVACGERERERERERTGDG